MSDNRETLLLIDGLSMAFRAFFALPVENFATSTGEPTNAVYGFSSMLSSLMQEHRPSHVAVAFDLPGGTFRTERLPSYKGTRDATPPEFEPQVPLIREVLAAIGVAAVDKERYEADDLLATYARLGREAGLEVLVVSGDRDTIQLVNDDVTLLYPRRGVSDLTVFTPASVEEKYAVAPHQYPELAALVGETSDNLPGVPGVGPKTAAKWIAAFGSLDEILERSGDVPGKAGESLRAHLDQVRLNRELNHLVTDLDVAVPVEGLRYAGGEREAIDTLCDTLQFRGLRARLMDVAGVDGAEEPDQPAQEEIPVVLVDAVDDVVALEGDVALEVAGRTGADADAWGLGVAAATGAWGIDLTEIDASETARLSAWLEGDAARFVLHDAKAAAHALAARGIALAAPSGDTQIGAFLTNPAGRSFDLESVAERVLGRTIGAGAATGELDLGLGDDARVDSGRRALAVRDLDAAIEHLLEERRMTGLYTDMEVPLIEVLTRMESTGVAVDRNRLEELESAALARAEDAAGRAYESLDGDRVNLASPKQLQEVLFERLGLPKTRKIKTGYSTDAASLTDLFAKEPHPFLEALLAHRDATKLAQIIRTLIDAIADDGRIHTTFSQVVASTGRLSSRDPNLQNIPIRTDEGHRIREAFVVGEGFETLLTADYSQIEMRIMAHLSGDEALIAAFKAGEDLHSYVGSKVFGVEPSEVTPAMRSKVKAMSYGLAYGLSPFGLSRQLGIDVAEAQELMDGYFSRFGAVRDYLKHVVEEARRTGYTETMFGRRRYLPDLTSSNRQRREIAERAALNAPIQGSAADLIKRAMLDLEERLRDAGMASRQVLQIHDEVVVEVAPGEVGEVETLVRTAMAEAGELSVPLDVNVGTGPNWRVAGH